MKNKLLIIILTYTFFILVSIGLKSCLGTSDAKIKDISFSAFPQWNDTHTELTLNFTSYSELDYLAMILNDLEPVQECYAFRKCYQFLNHLDQNSIQLSFGQDLYYLTDTIAAGTNILDIQSIKKEMEIEYSEYCDGIDLKIKMNPDLTSKFDFQLQEYDVNLFVETDDGIAFTKTEILQLD